MQTIKEVVIYTWSSPASYLYFGGPKPPIQTRTSENPLSTSHPNSAPQSDPATFSSLLVICSYNSEILDLQRSKGWNAWEYLFVDFLHLIFISVSMIITMCHFENICFIKQYFFPYCGGVHGGQTNFIVHWCLKWLPEVKSLKNS